MEFEWDEAKRQEIIERRDIDIVYAARIFRGPILTEQDLRKDYGEDRYIAIGLVEDRCFVVAYTYRGTVIRLITAWEGGRHVREEYKARIAGRH